MNRLKIRKEDSEHIKLEAIGGIEHFGFGTFLCGIQPEEIDCDQFSKDCLINAKEKHGLNYGLEIWQDNRIAWGNPSETIVMPISEISKALGSDWLEKIEPQQQK